MRLSKNTRFAAAKITLSHDLKALRQSYGVREGSPFEYAVFYAKLPSLSGDVVDQQDTRTGFPQNEDLILCGIFISRLRQFEHGRFFPARRGADDIPLWTC